MFKKGVKGDCANLKLICVYCDNVLSKFIKKNVEKRMYSGKLFIIKFFMFFVRKVDYQLFIIVFVRIQNDLKHKNSPGVIIIQFVLFSIEKKSILQYCTLR